MCLIGVSLYVSGCYTETYMVANFLMLYYPNNTRSYTTQESIGN